MPLKIEAKAKLLISNDSGANPQDVAFNSGEKAVLDTTTYNEATSKVLNLAASTVDQQVDLDGIVSVALLFIITSSPDCSVTLVPTGKTLAECSALSLLPNAPLLVGSDIVEIYLSNASATTAASVKLGAAGN
jgi:hypothetical protein